MLFHPHAAGIGRLTADSTLEGNNTNLACENNLLSLLNNSIACSVCSTLIHRNRTPLKLSGIRHIKVEYVLEILGKSTINLTNVYRYRMWIHSQRKSTTERIRGTECEFIICVPHDGPEIHKRQT
jgi:hypothetical protein